MSFCRRILGQHRWLAATLLAAMAFVMPAARAQDAGGGALNPLTAIDPSSLKGFVQKPLFSPSRREAEQTAPTETTAAIAPESLNLRLLGVIVTPQGAVARIEDLDGGEKQSLREGEPFRDWTVVSIDPASLTLGRGDETASFSVFTKPAVPPIADSAETDDTFTIDGNAVSQGDAAGEDVTQPPRTVRIIEETGPAATQSGAGTQSTPKHNAQDLIDFFGKDAVPPAE